MSLNEETTHIGNKKQPSEESVISYTMEAMPIPGDWGIGPSAAAGKGNLRLIKGRIDFVRLDVALWDRIGASGEDREEEVPLISPAELDPADRTIGDDRRRGVLNRERSIDLYELEQQIKAHLPFQKGARTSSYETEEDARFAKARYRTSKEVEQIRGELEVQSKRLMFHLAAVGAITLFLGLMELLPAFGVPFPEIMTPQGSPIAYLLLSLGGLGFVAYFAIKDIIAGLRNIAARRYNTCTAVAIAVIAGLAHMIYMLVMVTVRHVPATNTFAAPICLAVLIYTFNRLMRSLRVARGFGIAAKHGTHCEVLCADDSSMAADLRLASGSANAKVAYVVRTKKLAHYFTNAFREDRCSLMMSRVYPYFVIASVVTAVIGAVRALFIGGDVVNVAFSALCAALVTGIPITGLLCLEVPLSHMANKLRPIGALLNGWNAVDKFGDTDGFAINTTDLFPRGSVKVRRSFAVADMDIEEVTAAAASVLIASGGALAEVFGALTCDEPKLRESVDGIEYENELGISAWIRERRILVGNRDMMEAHRVVVPNGGLARLDEFEALKKRPGHQVLYVAVNSRLMGVYLLEYKATLSARNALVRLVSDGTNVMIYTCDANINIKLITSVFDIPARFISIMDNEGSRTYDSVTYDVTDSEEALLATDGSLKALSAGIRAAVRLKENESLNLLIQSICFGMGFLFVAGLSCISPYAIDAAQILIMQMVFALISLLSLLRALW